MDISNKFSISGGLLWELVSRWDVRSRGFRVRDRIVPFTLVDVSFTFGLSIVGKFLVVEEDQQCQTLDLFKGPEVTINNIRKQLRCHKKKLVNFVRLYMLLAFTEFYFPKTGNKVFTGFIKQLDDLDSLDAHSWRIVVYNFVVSSLCESPFVLKKGKNKAQRHLNGCAAILQIWAFNHLSLGKAPAVSRFSFPRVLNWPVISMQKKNIEKAFEKNMIIDKVVATEEELKYDIVNAALFQQGQEFVDVIDYHRLVAENKDFKERIAVLEHEVRMMKEARVNTPFEDEVVQDDRQLVDFITEDEVGTLVGYVGHNTPFNDDVNGAENQSKSKSNMATRMRKKPRKCGKRTRMNL
ncbi:protein MAIN-LIKE 1 [Lathyrus oleraceus]|nr:protein MAIN-LIKE 1-like [Pisum sativum]